MALSLLKLCSIILFSLKALREAGLAEEKTLRKCGWGWDLTSTCESARAVVAAIGNIALARKGQVRQMRFEAR